MALRTRSETRVHGFLLITACALVIWSGIAPRDRGTWALEVAPAILGGILLMATYRRFRFTTLAYVLIWLHAIILILGGHWTYSEMPLFNWIRDTLELKRNHYDRLGHFAQGFVPAILAREVLLRTSPVRPGKWLFFLTIAICLAISAAYELLEWAAASLLGHGADQFLATQGDEWDTQKDMLCALLGAIVSLGFLSRLHDRSLLQISETRNRPAAIP